MEEGKKKQKTPSASFVTGAIALVFLIIGYEVAVFVHKAAVTRIEAGRDHPDTVYVYVPVADTLRGPINNADAMPVADNFCGPKNNADGPQKLSATGRIGMSTVRKNASHSPVVEAVRAATRQVESFRFNPNTVSVEDLQRLGFSEKQAQSIDNYRQKGGRFRRKEDFAKSYVVADSVYARLEPFIDIPKLDINTADSTALLDLPGIGPYFAGKIVSYRKSLHGYSRTQQLMDIYHFDRARYDGLSDFITCSKPVPYPLWTLPEEELRKHPYISGAEAHAIVVYREHHAPQEYTLEGLKKESVLSQEHALKLEQCVIDH